MVANEMLKRGFTEGDTHITKSGSITIMIDDRPATLFLANSSDANVSHVSMYHHQGVDVSKVPLHITI